MRKSFRLFLVLLTIVVILITWITGRMGNPRMQLLILLLIGFSVLVFAGLTWGGGNIKASEAKRGTKRKFLGQ